MRFNRSTSTISTWYDCYGEEKMIEYLFVELSRYLNQKWHSCHTRPTNVSTLSSASQVYYALHERLESLQMYL
jgi:hypothetical protein